MMWTLAIMVCLSGDRQCQTWVMRPIDDQRQCLMLRNSIRRMWWDLGFLGTDAECFKGVFG